MPGFFSARRYGGCYTDGLPDDDLVVAAADHRVAGLALERGGEGRQVRGGTDGAEVRRGMRVGGQAHLQLVVLEVAAPHGGPVHEEALVAGVAVDHRVFLALGG